MKPLLVSKNMNMDMSVSSNESVNGTETMKMKLKQIEKKEKRGKKAHSALGFQSLESFETKPPCDNEVHHCVTC